MQRHIFFFSLCGLPFPGRLSTVPVSRNFFNSLLTPRFVQVFSGNTSVKVFAVYPFKYKPFKNQNLVLVAEYHVDCWQTLQWRLLWRIFGATNSSQYNKQVNEQWHGKLFAISMAKSRYFRHRKYQNCRRITKLDVIKNAICLRFLLRLHKIWIFNFPRWCSNVCKVS